MLLYGKNPIRPFALVNGLTLKQNSIVSTKPRKEKTFTITKDW